MAPQRGKAAGKRRSGSRAGSPRWLIVAGVVGALGLAVWAGLAILSLGSPAPDDEPAHADIEEDDRERLVEILRQDEAHEP